MTKNNQADEYRQKELSIESQLTADNRGYFEKLRSYLVFSGLAYDETALQQQLLGMAGDLLEAQQHGEDAVSFFGNDPQGMADEILQNTPRASWQERLKYVGLTIGVFWGITLLQDFPTSGPMVINPLSYLLSAVLAYVLIIVVFRVMQRSVYQNGNGLLVTTFVLAIIAFLLVTTGADYLFRDQLGITLPYPVDLFLIVGCGVVGMSFILLRRKREEYGWLFLIGALGISGGINRFANGQGMEIGIGMILLPLVLIGIGAVLQIAYTTWAVKQENQRE